MVEQVISTLKLDFQSNVSSSKVAQINELYSALSKLNTVKLNKSAQTALSSITTSLGGLDVSHANGLDAVVTAISKLNGVKLSGTLGNGLLNLTSGINQLGTVSAVPDMLVTNLEKLGGAMQQFEGVSTNFNGVAKLITVMQNMGEIKPLPNTVIQNAEKLATALNTLSANTDVSDKRLNALAKSANAVAPALKKAEKPVQTIAKSFTDLYYKGMLAYRVIGKVVTGLGGLYSAYGEAKDTIRTYQVALGEASAAGYKYAQEVSNAYGIDPYQFMQFQSVYASQAKAMGYTAENAAKLSKTLTELTYDYTSFFDAMGVTEDDAFKKISSALSGRVVGVGMQGVDLTMSGLEELNKDLQNTNKQLSLTDETLRNTAMSMGFDKPLADMTRYEKSQLRVIALTQQLAFINGDWAKSLKDPNTQLKIFQAQTKQLKVALGTLVYPIANALMPVLIAAVQLVTELARWIAKLFGIELPEISMTDMENQMNGASDASGDVADNLNDADKAAKKLKRTIAGFDEVYLIQEPDTSDSGGSGASGGGVGGGADLDIPSWWDTLAKTGMAEQIEGIKEKLKDVLPIAEGVGAGLLAWKLSSVFLKDLAWTANRVAGIIEIGVGVALFASSIQDFNDAELMQSIQGQIGAVTKNVLGTLMTVDGITRVVPGKGGIAIAAVVGIAMSAITIFDGINKLKDDDPSNDLAGWLEIISGSASAIGSIAIPMLKYVKLGTELSENAKKAKGVSDTLGSASGLGGATSSMKQTTPMFSTFAESMDNLAKGMKSLIKPLLYAIPVIALVALNIALLVIEIAAIGWLIANALIPAWKPVIDNWETCLFALAIGVALFIGMGVAANAIGTAGSMMMVYMLIALVVIAVIATAILTMVVSLVLIGMAVNEVSKVLSNIEWGNLLVDLAFLFVSLVTMFTIVGTFAALAIVGASVGIVAGLLKIFNVNPLAGVITIIQISSETITKINKLLTPFEPTLISAKEQLAQYTVIMDSLLKIVVAFSKMSSLNAISSAMNFIARIFGGNKDPLQTLQENVEKSITTIVTIGNFLSTYSGGFPKIVLELTEYSIIIDKIATIADGFSKMPSLRNFSTSSSLLGAILGGNGETPLSRLDTAIQQSLIALAGIKLTLTKYSDLLTPELENGFTKYTNILNKLFDVAKIFADSPNIAGGFAVQSSDTINGVFTSTANPLNKLANAIFFSLESLKIVSGHFATFSTLLEGGESEGNPLLTQFKNYTDILTAFFDVAKLFSDTPNIKGGLAYQSADAINGIFPSTENPLNEIANAIFFSLQSLEAANKHIDGYKSLLTETTVAAFENYTNILSAFFDIAKLFADLPTIKGKVAFQTERHISGVFTSTENPLHKIANAIYFSLESLETASGHFEKFSSLIDKGKDNPLAGEFKNYTAIMEEFFAIAKKFSEIPNIKDGGGGLGRWFATFFGGEQDPLKKIKSSVINSLGVLSELKGSLENSMPNITGTSALLTKYYNELSGISNTAGQIQNLNIDLNNASINIGTNIAKGVEQGINRYRPNLTEFTNRLKNGMQVSFQIHSPSRWADQFIGQNIGAGVERGLNNYDINADGLKQNVAYATDDMWSEAQQELDSITSNFAKVPSINSTLKSENHWDNANTDNTIRQQTDTLVNLLERIADGVDRGAVIMMDGEVISRKVSETNRDYSARTNRAFGARG